MENKVSAEFAAQSCKLLDQSLVKIVHCLEQLDDQQVWWRPDPALNSIGNLILHICGNLKQWAECGVGGAQDRRDRPAEFAHKEIIPKAELMKLLDEVTTTTKQVINEVPPAAWTDQKVIQEFPVTKMGAILHTTSHFACHTHQIILMTRLQLGDNYRFHWTPEADRQQLPI